MTDNRAEGGPQAPLQINYLKVRDDHHPVCFEAAADGKLRLSHGGEASWLSDGECDVKDLRDRIEPWLTSLFQSEHLSLLAGSGLTHAVHNIAVGTQAAGMRGGVTDGRFKAKINAAAAASAKAAGRDRSNLEDHIRVANEFLRGLEIFGATKHADLLRSDLSKALYDFAQSILVGEADIAAAPEQPREQAFISLIMFLMSFAGRTGTRDRLNIFTTNYDRVIEAGAEMAGLHLLDRFLGTLMPLFRSSRLDLDMHYNPPGIRGEPRYLEGVARFTKLHGSVDWVQTGKDIRRIGLPFGAADVDPYLRAPGIYGAQHAQLMIYPNAAKDRETAAYPYVELFRDFAAVVCRPNSTLVTYGYGFGDEHINRVVHDMLTIPSTHVVAISRSDSLGRILPLAQEMRSQVSVLVGPQLADLATLTEHFLPKAAIDRATFRMSEILRQRFGTDVIRHGGSMVEGQPEAEDKP